MQYQLLPDLTGDEYASLKADIALRGVMVPVELDEVGNVLDGHHRVRACAELGITDYPRLIRTGMSEDEKIEHVLSLNLNRRHLDADQRAELVVNLRAQGWSLRRIGDRLDVGLGTVHRDLEGVPNGTPDGLPSTVTGKDGKQYPAKQATSVVTTTPRDTEKALEFIADGTMPETPFEMLGDLRSADHKKDLAAKREEVEAQAAHTPIRALVTLSDQAGWLTRLFEKGPADLLLTDPPYSTDIEDIWAFASEWLPSALLCVNPTGRAYVFVGAYPEELEAYLSVGRSSEWLELQQVLVWTYRNTLGPSPTHLYKQNWQAILYFTGPDALPLDCPLMTEQFSVQDVNAPDGRIGDRYHAWQKPDELAQRLIRHSTKPGDLVIDPFCGTGTFLLAAAALGRRAWGCDRD